MNGLENALRDSEHRYRQLVHSLPFAFYTCDAEGRVTLFNDAAAKLWGREPQIGKDLWCGSWRLYSQDGSPLPLEKCPMALTLCEGSSVRNMEIIVERPDGSRSRVLPHPAPIRDAAGKLVGAMNMLVDITERKQTEEELRQSEQCFVAFMDNVPAFAWIKDLDGRYLYLNKAAKQVVEEWRGKTDADLWPAEVAAEYRANDQQVLTTRASLQTVEAFPIHGKKGYVLANKFPIFDEAGAVVSVGGTSTDITERQLAEDALRKREAQLEEAQELAHLGYWEWDILADTLFWSDELYRIFAITRDEFAATDKAFFGLIHPEDRARMQEAVDDALAGRKPYTAGEFRIVRPDLSERLLHSRGRVIRNQGGKPIRMFGVAQDVTARHQTEEELQRANEQMHTLSRRLFQVQEDERRHLAREIHDQFGQTLTAAKINLQTAKQFTDRDAIAERLDESIAIMDQLLEQTQQISLNLRPPLLDDLGLIPALRWYLHQQAQNAGFNVEFFADPTLERLSPEIETACFRIAQEALTNIVRHAEARRVNVELHRALNAVHLTVRDDGKGFDVGTATSDAKMGRGFGLLGMGERISLVGGQLDISSSLNAGTEVYAFFPVSLAVTSEDTSP